LWHQDVSVRGLSTKIGGFDSIQELDMQGKLDALIKNYITAKE
jgi:hypothetical protein